jgi:hypothetical protein
MDSNLTRTDCHYDSKYHQHYLITSGDYDKNGLVCSGCNSAVVQITKCKECGHEVWNWISIQGNNDVHNV